MRKIEKINVNAPRGEQKQSLMVLPYFALLFD